MLSAIFLFILVVIGGVYIGNHLTMPDYERIQVFCVGLGIYIGVLIKCFV